jgi:hypothetical protein
MKTHSAERAAHSVEQIEKTLRHRCRDSRTAARQQTSLSPSDLRLAPSRFLILGILGHSFFAMLYAFLL